MIKEKIIIKILIKYVRNVKKTAKMYFKILSCMVIKFVIVAKFLKLSFPYRAILKKNKSKEL